jgi:hypothetical protein
VQHFKLCAVVSLVLLLEAMQLVILAELLFIQQKIGRTDEFRLVLSAERGALEHVIAELKKNKDVFDRLEGQQMLLKRVFEVGITYDGRVLRTPSLNPALIDNYLGLKNKDLLVVELPDEVLPKSYQCTA